MDLSAGSRLRVTPQKNKKYKAAAMRLSMGKRYIFLGFSWGVDVRRALALF